MFCVMWLVLASSITEPSAEKASQSKASPAEGRGTADAGGRAGVAASVNSCGAAAWRPTFQAEMPQQTANSAYAALHTADCVIEVVKGSIANGNASNPASEPKFESANSR